MAMGSLIQIAATGAASNMQTPNASESILATDDLILHVRNANAAACTVTITDPGTTPSGSAATNPTVVVPATTGERFIYLPASLANPLTGLITAAFSVTASVTAEWLRA